VVSQVGHLTAISSSSKLSRVGRKGEPDKKTGSEPKNFVGQPQDERLVARFWKVIHPACPGLFLSSKDRSTEQVEFQAPNLASLALYPVKDPLWTRYPTTLFSPPVKAKDRAEGSKASSSAAASACNRLNASSSEFLLFSCEGGFHGLAYLHKLIRYIETKETKRDLVLFLYMDGCTIAIEDADCRKGRVRSTISILPLFRRLLHAANAVFLLRIATVKNSKNLLTASGPTSAMFTGTWNGSAL
jgi:hypothetical protein